jgi:BirA family biotin operon repressor/biotin-[acetyl-CoA-carboxylase] ligase
MVAAALGPIERLDEVDSTNAEALRRVDAGTARDGLVLVASRQTSGHGSHGRRWQDVEGRSLAWSALVAWPAAVPLTIATWLGVVATTDWLLERGLAARVKWPNDALVRERKIAGVLAETRRRDGTDWVVLGIGVNVGHGPRDFPEGFATPATSLALEGVRVTVAEAAAALTEAVAARWLRLRTGDGAAAVRDAFAERLGLLGRRVVAEVPMRRFEGELLGLDLDGTLTLRRNDAAPDDRIAGGHVSALRAI